MTGEEQIEDWKKREAAKGATHIISVCDAFNYEDYPVFVKPGEDVKELVDKYNSMNMQRVNEVVELEVEVPTLPGAMTFAEFQQIVDEIEVGWGRHKFQMRAGNTNDRWWLQVTAELPNVYDMDGPDLPQHGGKAHVSPYSTHDEIVKKALGLCLSFVEHEMREGFLYKGVRVFDPHVTIEALAVAAQNTACRAPHPDSK